MSGVEYQYEVTVDQGSLRALLPRLVARRVRFAALPQPLADDPWLVQVKKDDWTALEEELRFLETRAEGHPQKDNER